MSWTWPVHEEGKARARNIQPSGLLRGHLVCFGFGILLNDYWYLQSCSGKYLNIRFWGWVFHGWMGVCLMVEDSRIQHQYLFSFCIASQNPPWILLFCSFLQILMMDIKQNPCVAFIHHRHRCQHHHHNHHYDYFFMVHHKCFIINDTSPVIHHSWFIITIHHHSQSSPFSMHHFHHHSHHNAFCIFRFWIIIYHTISAASWCPSSLSSSFQKFSPPAADARFLPPPPRSNPP